MSVNNGPASKTASSASSSLLERLRSQDADAWQRLAKLYGPEVYRWARRSGLQDTDAADIVQEVFRSLASNISAFRRDRPTDSFRGWLWTIAKNKIHDFYRELPKRPAAKGGTTAQHLMQELPDEPPDETSESGAAGISVLPAKALELVRGEFHSHTWQAFWRVTVEGDKPADVAEDLRMSVAAVYMAKSRVFRRVREELSGLLD